MLYQYLKRNPFIQLYFSTYRQKMHFATRRISPGYIALDCERVKELELRAERELQS